MFEWIEQGEPVEEEFASGLDELQAEVEAAEVKKMLGGEHDRSNAIITIHPGAGGTESQDWAEMLLRMYLRWMERRGFKRELVDRQPGEDAGIKSATLTVTGECRSPWSNSGFQRKRPARSPVIKGRAARPAITPVIKAG